MNKSAKLKNAFVFIRCYFGGTHIEVSQKIYIYKLVYINSASFAVIICTEHVPYITYWYSREAQKLIYVIIAL